ncbi:MAG: hypothetical protein IKD89_04470 [Clostridia bacterium]|nr:hypothetical protein [Clostridia bacterium]
MLYIITTAVAAAALIKGVSYAVWCIKNKHAPGGVFMAALCAFSFIFLCFSLFWA